MGAMTLNLQFLRTRALLLSCPMRCWVMYAHSELRTNVPAVGALPIYSGAFSFGSTDGCSTASKLDPCGNPTQYASARVEYGGCWSFTCIRSSILAWSFDDGDWSCFCKLHERHILVRHVRV